MYTSSIILYEVIKLIRNKLAALLAERSLKITKVANETGISRNTITSTAQNDGKMIQLETINVLCQFLNVKPENFFEYLPYDFHTNTYITDIDVDNYGQDGITIHKLVADLFLRKTSYAPMKKVEFDFTIELMKPASPKPIDASFSDYTLTMFISIDLADKTQLKPLSEVWMNLTAGFRDDLKKQIVRDVTKSLKEQIIESDKVRINSNIITNAELFFEFNFESDILAL